MGRRGRASHGEGENHDAAEPLLDSDHHKVDIRSIEPVSVREPREGEAEEYLLSHVNHENLLINEEDLDMPLIIQL